MRELNQEEKATNADTWAHIFEVQKLVNRMANELNNRMFSHDQSKLADPEVSYFTFYTSKLKEAAYGSPEYKQFLVELKPALDHHYAVNRHHPEHHEDGIEGMNLIDLIEMLCDWKASTLRTKDGCIRKSLKIQQERFNISPQLMKILENTVDLIEK